MGEAMGDPAGCGGGLKKGSCGSGLPGSCGCDTSAAAWASAAVEPFDASAVSGRVAAYDPWGSARPSRMDTAGATFAVQGILPPFDLSKLSGRIDTFDRVGVSNLGGGTQMAPARVPAAFVVSAISGRVEAYDPMGSAKPSHARNVAYRVETTAAMQGTVTPFDPSALSGRIDTFDRVGVSNTAGATQIASARVLEPFDASAVSGRLEAYDWGSVKPSQREDARNVAHVVENTTVMPFDPSTLSGRIDTSAISDRVATYDWRSAQESPAEDARNVAHPVETSEAAALAVKGALPPFDPSAVSGRIDTFDGVGVSNPDDATLVASARVLGAFDMSAVSGRVPAYEWGSAEGSRMEDVRNVAHPFERAGPSSGLEGLFALRSSDAPLAKAPTREGVVTQTKSAAPFNAADVAAAINSGARSSRAPTTAVADLLRVAFGVAGSTAERAATRLVAAQTRDRRRNPDEPPYGPSSGKPDPRGDYDRFRTGAIDITVPRHFFPDDEGSEAFRWMTFPYGEDGQEVLDQRTLDAMFVVPRGDVSRRPGLYPNWADEDGRTAHFMRHVLKLIWAYRWYLPAEWPPKSGSFTDTPVLFSWKRACTAMPLRLSELYFETDKPLIEVKRHWNVRKFKNSTGTHYTTEFDDNRVSSYLKPNVQTDGSVIYQVFFGELAYRSQVESGTITVPPPYAAALAEVADLFLYWGNRAYWYAFVRARQGNLVEAMHLLLASFNCGRVALAAHFHFARTLTHEMAHVLYTGTSEVIIADPDGSLASDGHCAQACCPQGLAFFWWARMRARHGSANIEPGDKPLPPSPFRPGTTEMIDTLLTTNTGAYASGCLGHSVEFVGQATFDAACTGGACRVGSHNDWTWTNEPSMRRPTNAFPSSCAPVRDSSFRGVPT